MWTKGYNDGAADLNISDSFNSRKLRPLFPRPMANPSSSINPPCFSHAHGTDHFFSLNHHLGGASEQNKREYDSEEVIVSSRWNPTPEQLRTLEELYRRGTRTPSAEQIQDITAQLRRYGKIEGKNVFYWFQNHKARERQKRRRQMEADATAEQHKDNQSPENKDSGASMTGFEVEQTKNWAPSTNCSTQIEESISIQRASKAAAIMIECKTDGLLQFDEGELQQRRNFMEKNATWAMMQLSCQPHTHTTHPIELIPTTGSTAVSVDPKLINTHQHLNLYATTPYRAQNSLNLLNHAANNEDNGCGESLTLELFPLRSSYDHGINCMNHKETHDQHEAAATNATTMNSNDFITPHHFYEFLPLKN